MAMLSEKEGKLSETRRKFHSRKIPAGAGVCMGMPAHHLWPSKMQRTRVEAWGLRGQGGWIENLTITLGFSVGKAEKWLNWKNATEKGNVDNCLHIWGCGHLEAMPHNCALKTNKQTKKQA